jgi:SAM-dependent methyltransferase
MALQALMPADGMRTWSALDEWQAGAARVRDDEAGALAMASTVDVLPGHCGVCARHAGFAIPTGHSMREGLICRHCGCNARQRAAAAVLLHALERPGSASVYLTEHASAFYLALRPLLGRLRGSEYAPSASQRLRLSSWLWRHGTMAWVHHGDVTSLTLPDGGCDGVVSLDVLEHVPDYPAALREFARVLKPGGVLVLTVPFYEQQVGNERVAWTNATGVVEHAGEPEYHGDPLGGGVLCFHHFGWALLDALRDSGFAIAEACRVQDLARGLPQGQWVIRARR